MPLQEINPLLAYPPDLGAALWAMQDTRTRTLDAVSGLRDAEVDARVVGSDNTIGATLYHIAAIEADWLYNDILLEDYPEWLEELFPYDVREEDGRLSPVDGFSSANHLERLATVRAHFLDDIRRLDPARFRHSNELEEFPSTPQWVLHHLCQHEAEHRGQIQSIRSALLVG